MKIYKYPLVPEAEINVIEMPQGATMLSCGLDPRNVVCLWAAVDPNAETEIRNVHVIGTGWNMDNFFNKDVEFVGTVKDGDFMWHIFVEDPS